MVFHWLFAVEKRNKNHIKLQKSGKRLKSETDSCYLIINI